MHPLLNETAKAIFIEQMEARSVGFSFIKSRKAFLPGAAVFERVASPQRRAWLAFNGFKSSYFVLGAGWTVTGLSAKTLDHWALHAQQIMERSGIPPENGYVDLRERHRFFKDGDPYYNLDLPTPTDDIRSRGYESYLSSTDFEEEVQKTYRGAMIIHKKNPPTIESIREERKRVEWINRGLWGHLVDRGALSQEDVRSVVLPIVVRAVEIACNVGVPFLNQRIDMQEQHGGRS